MLALLWVGAAAWPADEATPAAPLVIEGGTVLTMAGPPLEGGQILVAEGKIKALGPTVDAPAEARHISAAGKTVLPGFIDAMSCLYLSPQELALASLSPSLRVTDGVDLFARHTAEILASGVTAVHVAPGARALIAGGSGVARVAATPGVIDWVRELIGLRGQIGRPAGDARSSLDRLGDYAAIREALLGARDYRLRQEAYDRAMVRWENRKQEAKKKNEPFEEKRPDKPARDPGQETLLLVLKGELPLQIEAHRVVDILNALRLQDDFGVKLVLLGASEGYKVAGEIARRHVPVIVAPVSLSFVFPSHVTYGDHSRENAARLAAAGVRVALGVGGTEGLQSRFVRACAAMAAARGLEPRQALEAVTIRAAEALGVADRIGSLAPGKDADLIIIAGDPLDVRAPVEMVIQAGRVVYERGASR